ncbi:MAG: hypothetical protein K9L56_13045 [Clostridiales bacterium]|nr:hypothetical protein [Clostridiales bacterium]
MLENTPYLQIIALLQVLATYQVVIGNEILRMSEYIEEKWNYKEGGFSK